MEFPKDKCTFCEHTTRNAHTVNIEYLRSIEPPYEDNCELALFFEKVLSKNLDVLLPLLRKGKSMFYGGRKNHYCGIFDSLGNDLLGLEYIHIVPPVRTDRNVFVLQNKHYEWGVINLDELNYPKIIVPFGKYKHIWGYDTNHSLVQSKIIDNPATFEGRGIINSQGELIVGVEEYKDIWTFYRTPNDLIKAETFDNHTIYLLKRNPLNALL